MREKANDEGVDLLLIDTGDRIEGNGLYDASHPKGVYTSDIFKKQDIDVICSGNHELYRNHSSNDEYLKTVPNFQGNYLASNLDIIDPSTGKQIPLAQRYRKFSTTNQGIRILAFGFVYNFRGNSNNTVVQPVQDTMKEGWFQQAIRDREVDLFLVIGHAEVRSEEFRDIFRAIREVRWDTPIQFFGGHLHIRDYKKYDSKAYALASGRFMETIGFMSITGLSTGSISDKNLLDSSTDAIKSTTLASPTFSRLYIDNNLYSFHHHTSLNSTNFPTPHGLDVSAQIFSARKALLLDHQYGCAPQDLWTNRAPYPHNSSIFTWLQEQVLPDAISDHDRNDTPRIVILNTGAMRFDIFKGPFTIDTTYSVSPFTSGFRYIKDVPLSVASKILPLINNEGPLLSGLDTRLLTSPEQRAYSTGFIASQTYHRPQVQNQISLPDHMSLTPGYTTHDDTGSDGDDTIHSPISFYDVPNCIETRIGVPYARYPTQTTLMDDPDILVDLVYGDFIEPWILLGLKFLGTRYEIGDTEAYMKGISLTEAISNWVLLSEMWHGDCSG